MAQKVLITGRTRSGTTFLTNFLNAQEYITMYSDIFHVVAGKILGNPVRIQVIDYHKPLSVEEKKWYLSLIELGLRMLGDKTDYVLKVKPADFNTAKELYDLLLASIIHADDRVVGHKVTEVEGNITNILQNTDLKVIYIVRDPRDVIPSQMKKFGASVFSGIQLWKKAVQSILEINSDKILIIKFEDLINKDEKLRQRLEEFLSVPITYEIKTAVHHKQDFVANSSFSDVDRLFDTRAVNRWKNKKDFLIKYIYMQTLNIIQKLGYDYMKLDERDLEEKNKLDYLLDRNRELIAQIQNNNLLIHQILDSVS